MSTAYSRSKWGLRSRLQSIAHERGTTDGRTVARPGSLSVVQGFFPAGIVVQDCRERCVAASWWRVWLHSHRYRGVMAVAYEQGREHGAALAKRQAS